MRNIAQSDLAERLALLLPLAGDRHLVGAELRKAGLEALFCGDVPELLGILEECPGVVVIAEETLDATSVQALLDVLDRQPPWSAVPLAVLVRERGPALKSVPQLHRLETRHQVTFLQRPVTIMSFISTMRVALQSRRRQYQVRDLLQQLEQDVKRRDEFLAMLGHELRNPLAPIANAAELLKFSGESLGPVQIERAAGLIGRQVHHLSRLVDDLLDVARISSGRIEIERKQVNLTDTVNRAVEMIQPSIGQRSQELVLSLPAAPLFVTGDAVRLAQTVGNLLHNASKYTQEGGRISLGLKKEAGSAVLSVRDNGTGIQRELLRHVFDLFRQADKSLARTSGGLGLGLTLVKRLTELQGGEVEARSEGPGKGAEFIVRLPLVSRSTLDEWKPAGTQGDRQSVLIIEDNRDAADSLATLLQAQGHEVEMAYNGEAGIVKARRLAPDVVFIDIGLPDIDGCEVARRLRPALAKSSLLIGLSGYADHKLDSSLFDHYLLKPPELLKIDALLRERQGRERAKDPVDAKARE